MKRRSRFAFGAAVLMAALLAILAVVCRDNIRDHIEVWRFQLTRHTETLEPLGLSPEPASAGGLVFGPASCFQVLATYSNRRVTIDPDINGKAVLWTVRVDGNVTVPVPWMLTALREDGYRILEQQFPGRAYVVIRHER